MVARDAEVRARFGAAEKVRRRLLRLLVAGDGEACPSAKSRHLVVSGADAKRISVDLETLQRAVRDGLIAHRGKRLALTPEGRAALWRAEAGEGAFAAQHRLMGETVVATAAGPERLAANLAESPLGKLRQRSNRKGEPFLSDAEFRAGERLRADYTRGQLMPRLGANWQAAVASGRRDGGAGGAVDLTDAALAARQRVERALEATGPELSGVLIDICCFLKGLEQVESERGWPVRSAKVVLKTALAALGRHYDPSTGQRDRGKGGRILHWGADGYRPTVG